MFSQTKCESELRLGKVTRSALDHPRLRDTAGGQTDARADGIAIRFCTHQVKTNTAIAAELIVAKEKCGAVVGCYQQIQVAISVKVRIRQASSHFGPNKV